MKKEKNYKFILKIFLSIYPIFLLSFFYNSYFTLLQIIIIGIFILWNWLINKDSRKNIKYLIIYFVLILIYGLFHHQNALNFHSLIPGNFNYNWLQESLSLLKMSTPILFLYLIYNSKLTKKDYLQIIKSWILLISLSIILTNLFKISRSSYTGEKITASIISWFTKDYNYRYTASVGYFEYSNQISSLLVVIIPTMTYFFFHKKMRIGYMIALLLTCLMLGTRVSTIGGLLVLIASVTSYVGINMIKKQKQDWKKLIQVFLIIILYLGILPFSPAMNRYQNHYLLDKKILLASVNNEFITDLDYIKENYKYKLINEEFITKRYPYEYDPKFWLNIMNEPQNKRTDYRYLEIRMVRRVKEINNNKIDTYLGLTNTRIQNIFNIERDYILQYYAYGIIGSILFLGVYLFIFFKNIRNLKKNFNYFSICFLLNSILVLIVPYLSGNILNQIAIFIPLLFLSYNRYEKKESENL